MTLETLFTNIQSHIDNKLPFVAYNLPDSDYVKAFFQNDKTNHKFVDFDESGFIMSSYDQNLNVFFPYNQSDYYEIAIDFNDLDAVYESNGLYWNSDGQFFKDMVSTALDTISNSSLEKVVLSCPRVIPVNNELDLKSLFIKLLKGYKSAMVYLCFHPAYGIWMGASPELLLELESNRFSTMSLAGTLKQRHDVKPHWTTKEIDEQSIVTDYIGSQLNTLASTVNIHPLQNVKAGNLWHLKTKITGVLNTGSSLIDLIKVLHPTPAVCGFPSDLAYEYIKANETYDRKFYTGFFGEVNMKSVSARNPNRKNIENNAYNRVLNKTTLFVNLRCMEITSNTYSIFVGAGITKDSNPKNEWQELQNKSETLSSIL